eukprot:CAMPEP_0194493868 /NCGR_PEP_ID=MMETSP0253-20130528/11950_1 /TAXON_ID=2966 /ORGANISM="Noctiluca scintillans" /LENGTH=748 /DNA_ID=CAMNT_0039334905 /DNA_START=78 /DNA_END=2324 /DNA_ORIENTATION=+
MAATRLQLGDMVEVWSNSKSAWMKGTILQVAQSKLMSDGHKILSGAIKVAYSADEAEHIKWVQPDRISAQVRKAESGSLLAPALLLSFPQGTHVDVWSNTKGAWIPNGVVWEVALDDREVQGYTVPKNSVKVSYKGGAGSIEKWVTADQVATHVRKAGEGLPSAIASACRPAWQPKAGALVSVWSNSKGVWVDGAVKEVSTSARTIDGVLVPAGSARVVYGGINKWIPASMIATTLRQTLDLTYSKGEKVEVWSNSKNAWMKDGQILEVATADSDGADPSVGEGSLKVKCGAGVKWIKPEYIAQQLRKISKISKYAEGDRVQVWSASKNDWIPDGLVLEVTTVEAVLTGYKVKAGSIKVSYSGSTKWITPDMADTHLKPADTDIGITVQGSCPAKPAPSSPRLEFVGDEPKPKIKSSLKTPCIPVETATRDVTGSLSERSVDSLPWPEAPVFIEDKFGVRDHEISSDPELPPEIDQVFGAGIETSASARISEELEWFSEQDQTSTTADAGLLPTDATDTDLFPEVAQVDAVDEPLSSFEQIGDPVCRGETPDTNVADVPQIIAETAGDPTTSEGPLESEVVVSSGAALSEPEPLSVVTDDAQEPAREAATDAGAGVAPEVIPVALEPADLSQWTADGTADVGIPLEVQEVPPVTLVCGEVAKISEDSTLETSPDTPETVDVDIAVPNAKELDVEELHLPAESEREVVQDHVHHETESGLIVHSAEHEVVQTKSSLSELEKVVTGNHES